MIYSEPLDQHIMKFRAKGKTCPLCQSTNIGLNTANTVICFNCHYHTTKKKRMERAISHPLFKELGWKIKKSHPDFSKIPRNYYP